MEIKHLLQAEQPSLSSFMCVISVLVLSNSWCRLNWKRGELELAIKGSPSLYVKIWSCMCVSLSSKEAVSSEVGKMCFILLYLRSHIWHPSWWFLHTFCLRLENEDLLVSWGFGWYIFKCFTKLLRRKDFQNNTFPKFSDVWVLSDTHSSYYWQIWTRKM